MQITSRLRALWTAFSGATLLAIALMMGLAIPASAQRMMPGDKPNPGKTFADKELLIRLKPGQGKADIDAIALKLNATVAKAYPLHNLYQLITKTQITPAQAKSSLANAANAKGQNLGAKVSYIQPNYVYTATDTVPNDPYLPLYQWSFNNTLQLGGKAGADVKALKAWDLWKGSSSVYVAVIDSGIDYTHPDLIDNVWTNPGETGTDANGADKATNSIDDDGNGYVDDVHGINACDDPYGYFPYYLPGDPYDDHFHGTHTAGTIGAKANNSQGVAGVNWDVQIIALKFLNGGGSGYTSDAVECLDYLHYLKTVKGLNIVASNNSWGGGGYDQALYDAIKQSGDDGILFIASAGNGYGNNNDAFPAYPASYNLDNIISVASTDVNDRLSDFSNIGKNSVDLGAPGSDIISTIPTWYAYYGLDIYYFLSGTSMAAPHVTGAAALLHGYDPSLTPAQIKKRLLDTGDGLGGLKNTTVSGRRLNLYNALTNTIPPLPVTDGKVYVDVYTGGYLAVGGYYYVYVYVHDNLGDPIDGAAVKIKVINPKKAGFVYLKNSSQFGDVYFEKNITSYDGPGVFNVTVTATKGGKTGTGISSFTVY